MQISNLTGVRLAACLAVVITVACGSEKDAQRIQERTAPTASRPTISANEGGRRIVVLGDSLTAGLGLPIEDAYPAVLQRRLDGQGLKYHVINAGISGDTSAGGLARLDWALEGDVRILIVALGGNDALRGLPVSQLKDNLSRIIQRGQARGVTVILAGLRARPGVGDPRASRCRRGGPASEPSEGHPRFMIQLREVSKTVKSGDQPLTI